MKTLKLENLKMQEGVEITKDQFESFLEGIEKNEYVYLVANDSFDKNTSDVRYYITKTGKKGSVINIPGHPDGGLKADKGIFELELDYTFQNPANFNEKENVSKKFQAII